MTHRIIFKKAHFQDMSGLLDDLGRMAALDQSSMLQQIVGLPQQIEEAISWDFTLAAAVDSVCICGVGGSAVGGDILTDYSSITSTKQVYVARGMDLPKWVGKKTLVALVSYSGNTWEVLDLLEKARERGGPLVGITSGGGLLKKCKDASIPVIEVPPGLQPRAALGYLLGSSALVIQAAGAAPAIKDLKRALPAMVDLKENLSPGVPTAVNMAKKIALKLNCRIPVIYAPRTIKTIAYRWQTQINENAKMLAFSGEFPEMNHNHIVGWVEGELKKDLLPVFLKTISIAGSLGEKMAKTIQLIKDHGIEPVVVELSGRTPLETSLMGIMLGDFISYYLAMLRGVDPSPVSSIQELKNRMR